MSPPPTAVATVDVVVSAAPADVPLRQAVSVRDRTAVGIICIVVSTLFFSAGDVAAKFMTDAVDPLQVTWFRFAVFLLVVPAALLFRGPGVLIPKRPRVQAARGFMICLGSTLFIIGLGALPVAENTAIAFLGPLFVTALSIPLLKEVVGVRRWIATGVGFLGVMLIVRPGTDAFQVAALWPVAAALTGALGSVLTRMMSDEAPETTLVWTGAIGFLTLSVMMPFVWETPSADLVAWGVLSGLLSTAGHVFVVLGFRAGAASILAPFSYVQLFFSGVFAFIAFGTLPGAWTVAGILVIAASGLYTAHRERVRGVRRGGPTPPVPEAG